jgi:hypothetical protein
MIPQFRHAAAALGILFGSGAALADPSYYPSGPQSFVPIGTVLAGGWTQCYEAPMATPIGVTAQNVLNACQGDFLIMAGREFGADSFAILAAAERDETIVDTGQTSNTHFANGSQWWYAPDWSWGFTADGDTVTNNSCDLSDSPLSMCLHTRDGVGGYRIKNIEGLNDSIGYEKVFFVANDTRDVPEPATLALFGAGAFGLAALRRRKAA